jgi:ribosomal protein S18 acetylase RimI-like enzyme
MQHGFTVRTIEELSMNAWPALLSLVCDGWVLRFSDGYTRRANSVHPLYPSSCDLAAKIVQAERLYQERELPAVFKLTAQSQPLGLEAALVERGYEVEAETSVHVADLGSMGSVAAVDIETSWGSAGEWREAFRRMSKVAPERQATHERILASISPLAGFVSVRQEGQIVGCGLGVVQDGWLGVFDVIVDGAARRQGHGERLMRGLMWWGQRMGADKVYLQVMQSNVAAVQLYEGLGFREAYSYWYRVKR